MTKSKKVLVPKARRAAQKETAAVKEQDRRTVLKDHEDRVFKSASHFRIQRYQSNSQQDRMQVATFPEALSVAKDEIAVGNRVLIYAVTDAGSFIVLTPKRWDEYLKLWEEQHG